MKICPTCRKTYADENLNFCLEDGSVLAYAGSGQAETVIMNPPRPTDPNPAAFSQPPTEPAWSNQQQYSMRPKKSSKTWLWVVGILGLAVLLCGGGAAGLLLLASMSDSNRANSGNPIDKPSNTSAPSSTPFGTKGVDTVDLSQWVKDFSVWGTTEFVGDELMMASKQKGYYYVLVATDEYKTDRATTRVTLRNVDDAASNLGYGLIFHSDPTPLTRDFAFLIDTKRRKYRVVRHEPTKETTVVNWTSSSAIREGAAENTLEVRDNGDVVDLYINGQPATSIKNTLSPKGGVPGLYSGDAAKIGFKKMEIAR